MKREESSPTLQMRTVLINTPVVDTLASGTVELRDDPDHEVARLQDLHPGDQGVVTRVDASGNGHAALARRLLELGFVRGEHVEVLAEARPGRDPFVVRIGETTLAMRRSEAHAVHVQLHGAASRR
jgi:ferrous iron transport protein A